MPMLQGTHQSESLLHLYRRGLLQKLAHAKYRDLFFKSKNFKFFFLEKNDIFNNFAQNIDCGYTLEPPRQGGSNEYPQSMFWNKNKKKLVYPCKPQFYDMKVGFKRVYTTQIRFPETRDLGYKTTSPFLLDKIRLGLQATSDFLDHIEIKFSFELAH